MKTHSCQNWALIILLTGATSLIYGCESADTSPAKASATSASASVSTAAFQITEFYPAAGTVASLPTSVTVAFNESTYISSEVTNTANWIISCPSASYYASSISVYGDYASVTLPTISGLSAGESCTLQVNTNIEDSSGNTLGGTTSVAYTLSSSTAQIEYFSPAAGSYQTLPSTVAVTFSQTDLDASSVSNTANWTVTCGTNSALNPKSVSYSNGVATVTMPYVEGVSADSTCTLAASSSITDSSGNPIIGTLSAVYTITQAVGAPVGYLLSPLAQDRVYGTAIFAASAYGTGLNPAAITSVTFYLVDANSNEIVAGTSNYQNSTTGAYEVSYNTAQVRNGLYTLAIAVTDATGYTEVTADSVSIDIENHSELQTLSVGGSAGTAYTDYAPTGSNLMGIEVSGAGTINLLQPVWQSAYGADPAVTQGNLHGTVAGVQTALTCPSTGNYRVTGVFGYVGDVNNANPDNINQIGLVCQEQYDESGSTSYKTSTVGTATGSSFELDCTAGTFVVGIMGRTDPNNMQIQLICQ